MNESMTRAAVAWLAAAAPEPRAVRLEWERNPFQTQLLPAGKLWDVLLVPGRIGYPAFDVLARRVDSPGPVLADLGGTRTGFFVPPGTADRWTGTDARGAGRGTWIVVPCPGRAPGGTRWLVPPDGRGSLNDPILLDQALHEAAAVLAAGDKRP